MHCKRIQFILDETMRFIYLIIIYFLLRMLVLLLDFSKLNGLFTRIKKSILTNVCGGFRSFYTWKSFLFFYIFYFHVGKKYLVDRNIPYTYSLSVPTNVYILTEHQNRVVFHFNFCFAKNKIKYKKNIHIYKQLRVFLKS